MAMNAFASKNILLFYPFKLHIGCGLNGMPGWIHIDRNDAHEVVDLVWDVTTGLPFRNDSCRYIYHEHLLEHFPPDKGVAFLSECRRVLMPGGVMRIAMPSLDHILEKYRSADWKDQDWLTWPDNKHIATRAEMLNVVFYWWGHQWVYNAEELERRLREAGFIYMEEKRWRESAELELCDRETRKDSLLIYEARK